MLAMEQNLFLTILVIAWSTFPPLQWAVPFYDFLFCIAIGNSLETSISPHFFYQMLVFGYLEKYDFYSVFVRCTCPGVIENQDFVLNTSLEFPWKIGLKTWLNPKYIFLDWSSVNMVSLVDVFSVQIICRNVFLNPQLIRYVVSSHQFATITNTLFITCYFLVVSLPFICSD